MSNQAEAAVRASYDAVAREYEKQIADELDGKPLDRALLAAFAELSGDGAVADLGCGPGHIAAYLAGLGCVTVGVDLSPGMIDIARTRYPYLDFAVGSMLDLPVADGAWSAVVAMYSIIHLTAEQRPIAYREMGRVIRPDGLVMIAFHVSDATHAAGEAVQHDEFLGESVELIHHFLAPDEVAAGLTTAGFVEVARLEREPNLGAERGASTASQGTSTSGAVEYPSRRCYLIARRAGH